MSVRPGPAGAVLADELDGVAAAWTVLSTAFGREPEQAFVDALRSPEQLAAWPYEDPATSGGVRLLVRSGRGRDGRPESLEALRQDHRRLFVGPRPLLAAPWESVHRSREGLVFDVQTLQVREFYRRFGLQSPLLNKEPDDHVALEASFVATLALRALDALEVGDVDGAEELVTGIRSFTDQHLQQWVPDLLGRVEEHAETDYHLGLAGLTRGALGQLHHLDVAPTLS